MAPSVQFLRRCHALLVAILSLFAATLAAPAAQAADVPSLEGLSVRPVDAAGTPLRGAYFSVTRNAGSQFVGYVELGNAGKRTIRVRVAAVDATTSDTGGTAFLDRTAPRRKAGAWITPDPAAADLTLKPGTSSRVRFDVRVPADAAPGDHVGGLVVEPERRTKIKRSEQGAANSKRVLRVITAVQVRVRGKAIKELTVAKPRLARDGSVLLLTVRLSNDGALLCKPILTATLFAGGELVASERREVDTVLPGTAIDYVVRWGRPVKDDRYDVQVRTERCGAPNATRETLAIGKRGSGSGEGGADDAALRSADEGLSTAEVVGFAGLLACLVGVGWGVARRLPRRR